MLIFSSWLHNLTNYHPIYIYSPWALSLISDLEGIFKSSTNVLLLGDYSNKSARECQFNNIIDKYSSFHWNIFIFLQRKFWKLPLPIEEKYSVARFWLLKGDCFEIDYLLTPFIASIQLNLDNCVILLSKTSILPGIIDWNHLTLWFITWWKEKKINYN